jgi:hypothetical protein
MVVLDGQGKHIRHSHENMMDEIDEKMPQITTSYKYSTPHTIFQPPHHPFSSSPLPSSQLKEPPP